MVKSKMIKDPIHGFIEFEGEFENDLKDILGDPFFQRLRRVKQLGFSDHIFPSATHTRFAHSLGVYHVAKRMLGLVEPKVKDGEWGDRGKACLAAALLHDIGHGMFSHAFEQAIKLYLSKNSIPSEKAGFLKAAVNHEEVSKRIILDSSISKALEKIGGRNFHKVVAGIVSKLNPDDTYSIDDVYKSIVTSQLDADRLDYVIRDPYFAGVSSGGIDLDWIIRNLKSQGTGEKSFLYFDSKAFISVEQFTVTLFQLYPTIYLHKKTRGMEYMFSLMLSRIFELIESGKVKETGLTEDHPFVRFYKNPNDLQNAVILDDTVFWGSLCQLREAMDETVGRIAHKISNRQIFPMIDVWRLAEKILSGKLSESKMSASDRVALLSETCASVCEEAEKVSNDWSKSLYYDHYPRPIYKPKNVVGGDPQQINVEIGGEIIDISEVSPIVSSSASFTIHRIYYDDKIPEDEASLTSFLNDRLEAKINAKCKSI